MAVGGAICGFQLTGRLVTGNRPVVQSAVGNRPAERFVEEEEEQRSRHALRRETIDVSRHVTLQQSMAFELAQAIGFVGDVERGEDGLAVQPPT